MKGKKPPVKPPAKHADKITKRRKETKPTGSNFRARILSEKKDKDKSPPTR